MKPIIISLFLFIFTGSTYCDEVIEGKKNVSYYFELINIDSFPDYTFIAFPVNNSGGTPQLQALKLEQNKTIHLVCKHGRPEVYAIKKDLLKPDDIKFGEIYTGSELKKLDSFFTKNKNMIPCGKIYCTSRGDKLEPYSKIYDSYKIDASIPDSMKVSREKVILKDSDGNIIEDTNGEYKNDLLNGSRSSFTMNYVYYSLPFLAIIALVVFIVVRKKK